MANRIGRRTVPKSCVVGTSAVITQNTVGQAAGTAAVQSIRTGKPSDDLDTEQLVTTLRNAGAYLPQNSTAPNMTRTS